MKMKKRILIILLIIWMIIVFMFSRQVREKSSDISKKLIGFALDKLSITDNMSKNERDNMIENLQIPIRKTAHFTIYTIGGIISFTLVSNYKIKLSKKILIAIGICVLYAITDEIHQYFVPGRSSEIRDVLIDSAGAMLGIVIAKLCIKSCNN